MPKCQTFCRIDKENVFFYILSYTCLILQQYKLKKNFPENFLFDKKMNQVSYVDNRKIKLMFIV